MIFLEENSAAFISVIAIVSALGATAHPAGNNDVGKGAVFEHKIPSYRASLGERSPATAASLLGTLEADIQEDFLESISDGPSGLVTSADQESFSLGEFEKKSSEHISVDYNDDSKSVWQSFGLALVMILVSEIGDKTFFIAAVMAMKHPRMTVFSASFFALVLMTVVSAFIGQALPSLISKKQTNYLAAFLFLGFGLKMLHQAYLIPKNGTTQDELQQVEAELDSRDLKYPARLADEGRLEDGFSKVYILNSYHSGKRLETPIDVGKERTGHGFGNLWSLIFSPTWMQIFVMTFLAEWGDRSQVSTMLMAAGRKCVFVIVGAIAGHGVCTAVAVVGGKFLASRISIRTVTYLGSLAFLCFCVIYFYQATFI